MKTLMAHAFSRTLLLRKRIGYSLLPNLLNHDVPEVEAVNRPCSGKKIGHVAMYTQGNAGDTLLPRTVRDILDGSLAHSWTGIHAHRVVNHSLLTKLNTLDGVVIGGGGLFLRDTNPNNMSGWQWSCKLDALNRIDVPMAVFAVGYNRFREQSDFNPVFGKHLELLAKKSVYIGLRNTGSVNAIRSYLPAELHDKVRFQPCPTTLCKNLYPKLCQRPRKEDRPLVVLNCAFDRISLRLGGHAEHILTQLAQTLKTLSSFCRIGYYSHTKSDRQMLSYLHKAEVPFVEKNLFNTHAKDVMKAYTYPDLVLGMRGHSQMIPFGCGTPIISLISHDKIKWFLDDIGKAEWGIEMKNPSFKERLLESSLKMLENPEQITAEIDVIQNGLYDTSCKNAQDFIAAL
jgi:polysaccharide pyruvyl transferase WcaK-like protein